jgi:hypothetical protein
LLGTGTHTAATANAFMMQPLDFTTEFNAFGIMAPLTGQRATFEKYCCPQAGAIFGGHSLNVKNSGEHY